MCPTRERPWYRTLGRASMHRAASPALRRPASANSGRRGQEETGHRLVQGGCWPHQMLRPKCLCEVLDVNGAVTSKERQRDSRQNHRNQRADDRRVRCHPELQNQLDANNRTEDRENDQQREGCGGECRGVRLIGRAAFGFGLEVGHFLLTMRRYAQHGSPVESNVWSLSALLSSCYPLSDSGRSEVSWILCLSARPERHTVGAQKRSPLPRRPGSSLCPTRFLPIASPPSLPRRACRSRRSMRSASRAQLRLRLRASPPRRSICRWKPSRQVLPPCSSGRSGGEGSCRVDAYRGRGRPPPPHILLHRADAMDA